MRANVYLLSHFIIHYWSKCAVCNQSMMKMLLDPKKQGVTYYCKERSQFGHFSGLLCSKLLSDLQESRFLHNFTLYNPLLMKMCSVQSIDDADASWSQEQCVTYYHKKKGPRFGHFWAFLQQFFLWFSHFITNYWFKMCSVQSIDDADASWSQEQWVTYYLNKSVIQLYW